MPSLKQRMPSFGDSATPESQKASCIPVSTARRETWWSSVAGTQPDAVAADIQSVAAIYDSAHHSSIRKEDKGFPHSQTERGSTTSLLEDHFLNLPVLTPGSTDSSDNSLEPILRDAVEPSPLDAKQYLTTFRTQKSKYFPFVYISPATTAHQLRHERPFLWLCIMTVSSRSISQQQALGSKVRHQLWEKMVLQSEQNIDLLLGLLAYIGWYEALRSQLQLSGTEYFSQDQLPMSQ